MAHHNHPCLIFKVEIEFKNRIMIMIVHKYKNSIFIFSIMKLKFTLGAVLPNARTRLHSAHIRKILQAREF
ncbi:hypothetical protein BI317_16770 [Xanthomonas hortorum pv. gardneri]|nr:hypothetical protein BI317_16770 [Xanthomonas hortorum pv. gardneri]